MSIQVQLRRDTLANIQANHGAQGELFYATDTGELYAQDGSTNGGFPANGRQMPFGSRMQLAIAESSGAGGESLGTGATYTSTLQLPAGYKFILGAGWYVNTTITGPTSVDFGLVGSSTLFATGQTPSWTAGSTVIYGQNALRYDAAPVSLLLTSHGGSFSAGAVRFAVHFIMLAPPSS